MESDNVAIEMELERQKMLQILLDYDDQKARLDVAMLSIYVGRKNIQDGIDWIDRKLATLASGED